ncbi:hypothetical protein Ancab_005286 [Ancistrocladus abbreviatus]
MGCCVSTQDGANHHQQQISPVKNVAISKSPPRAEEETVKEVLSETPKPRSQISKISRFNGAEEEERKLATPKNGTPDIPKRVTKSPEALLLPNFTAITTPEEVSEVSELCSLSESLSTTTISEKREKEDQPSQPLDLFEVRQRVNRSPARSGRKGSFSGDSGLKRENVTGRSPVRRSDPSPRRKNDGMAMACSVLYPGQGSVRRGLTSDGQKRRDPGENSDRRSRSPATRVEGRGNLGRSPSGRKTGPSPGRVRMVQPAPPLAAESGRKVVEEEQVSREMNKWSTPNESLENPLVSLECFIFL